MKPTAVFRDPLFHFLLIGLALFLFYGRVSTETSDSRRIEVSSAQIDALAREFQSTWSRPPSTEELSGLINSYIHDEVLYREGVAMGLVADDPVIKRRVRQKLEVMSEESNAMVAPSDAELEAYLARHADKFRPPTVVSFEQVFFSADAPAAELEAKTTQALAALRAGAPAVQRRPAHAVARLAVARADGCGRPRFRGGVRQTIGDLATGDLAGADPLDIRDAPGARQ